MTSVALVLPIVASAWPPDHAFPVLNAVFWVPCGRVGPAPQFAVRRFGAKPL